ncbi:MAG: GntR family transcriptional regulator [Acidimicrobiaceae bacterium]|nr:GntR family transcriptional regulator [Acidimicrobiaceae bacterium]
MGRAKANMSGTSEQLVSSLVAVSKIEALIQEGIEAGTLRPGSRLPTEREFAEQLGISRATVRRALAHQEALGVVVRHQGRGTFVAPTESRPVTEPISNNGDSWADTSPSEVMIVRSMVEPEIALLAAQAATERDLERIEHCLREAVAAPNYEEFEIWDGAFHRAIAEATHNGFLLNIFDHINRVRSELHWGRLKRRSLTPDRRAAYEAEHSAVLAAIRERDGSQAHDMMSRHLRHVRDNMLHPERISDRSE